IEAMKLYPDARRVLLTAYADTDAAIRAINDVQLSHYLLKPWDPPQQHLYPVLDDLLEDWQSNFRPPFEGLRLLGACWTAFLPMSKSSRWPFSGMARRCKMPSLTKWLPN